MRDIFHNPTSCWVLPDFIGIHCREVISVFFSTVWIHFRNQPSSLKADLEKKLDLYLFEHFLLFKHLLNTKNCVTKFNYNNLIF